MKYFHLIWRNTKRKKPRFFLTIGSFGLALFLFGLLMSIYNAFYQRVEVAGADHLFVQNRISIIMPLPYKYLGKIEKIKGVECVTHSSWFGGVYQNEKNFFPKLALEPDLHLKVYSDFIVPEDQWANFKADRQGCVVGKDLAERFGWSIGDRVPIKGTIYPGAWEFNISGIYEARHQDADLSQFWFRFKYLEERREESGYVGWYVVKISDPSMASVVSEEIDRLFRNSSYMTKTQPEATVEANFVKQYGNVKAVLLFIGTIVFFTLLLITGSNMAMAINERIRELAILKALGYSNLKVGLIVLAESMIFSVVGGAIGLLAAKLLTFKNIAIHGLLPVLSLSLEDMAFGFFIALLFGFIAGIIPTITIMRLQTVDALRRF